VLIDWKLRGATPNQCLNATYNMSTSPQGVTHISKVVCYPEDPSDCSPPTWVAHWAHPLEAEWVAREPPPPAKWPVLIVQVGPIDARGDDKAHRYNTCLSLV
jgi:hypothetical protein